MKKAGENDKILPKSSGFPLFSPRYLSGSFSFNTYLFLGSSRLYIYMRWWASLSTHGAHSNGVVGVVKNSLGTSGGSNFRGGMIEISFVEKKKRGPVGFLFFCFFDSFLGFRWLMETVGECLKDERQHFVMMKKSWPRKSLDIFPWGWRAAVWIAFNEEQMLSFSRVAGGHQYIRHRCGISREQKAST